MTQVPTFFERARKFYVAALGYAVLVGGVLAEGDLSTWQGIVAAVIGVLGALGVYKTHNTPDDEVRDFIPGGGTPDA